MPEAVRQISHLRKDVQSDQYGSRRKNAEIGLHFLNLEGFLHPLCQKQIIKTEIHAEQEHENGDHNLKIRAVSGHAVGPDGKSAGSCGAEGSAQGIKKRHASDQEEKNLKRRHRDINAIQHQRRLAHSGNQLAHRRPRAFRPHQIHGLAAGKRNDLKQEYQHAHAADPVRKAAPEHAAAGKGLHIHQNTGACGCKTGNDLKQRIQIFFRILSAEMIIRVRHTCGSADRAVGVACHSCHKIMIQKFICRLLSPGSEPSHKTAFIDLYLAPFLFPF